MDNTSRLGRPGPDELVPSRYALRLGEIDVEGMVSDGVISISAEAMATNADPAVRSAWLRERLQPETMDWALNEVVVRSGGRTILIDSWLGMEAPDFPGTGRWSSRLEAAGIDLASVTDVVLTHMHFDHVGGLLVDGVKDRLHPDLADPRVGRRGRVLGGARFLPHRHAGAAEGHDPVRRQAVPGPVRQQAADLRDGLRGGPGCGRHSHGRPPPLGTAWSAWRPAATA